MLAARVLERFLEHAAGALALRRMEDPALAEPERDVVGRSRRAEADEIASPELRLADGLGRGFLLVCVSRDEPSQPAVSHVDEAGAVDPALGHPAPVVRRAEVRARLGDGIAVRTLLWQPRPRDCPLDLAQKAGPDPARVVVRRPHAGPVAVRLLDGQRLAAQRLSHLLGGVVGLGAHGRNVDRADADGQYAGRMVGSRRASMTCTSGRMIAMKNTQL